ncbi:MAG: GAF domain-containing protein, partial [Verrucomicrobia bacterium]|nr:GAF domain-containing protein [Leptolyngbya sp. ES-bin-22]
MIKASLPTGEAERQQALENSGMLDIGTAIQFDRLTHLARTYFRADFALVSLTDHDRQWFASSDGLDIKESPRKTSFCEHVLQTQDVLVVEDATKDDRFRNNPFVTASPPVRFYVGAPVRWQNQILGSFCVGGSEPRQVSEDDRAVLTNLAASVEREIELVRGAIECG